MTLRSNVRCLPGQKVGRRGFLCPQCIYDSEILIKAINYVQLHTNTFFTKISGSQILWGPRNPLRPTFLVRRMANMGRRVTIQDFYTFHTYIYYKRKYLAKFHDDTYTRDGISTLGPLLPRLSGPQKHQITIKFISQLITIILILKYLFFVFYLI